MFVAEYEVVTDALSIPVASLGRDWFGMELSCPPFIGCAIDPHHFHFRANRAAGACVHPGAAAGCFAPDLWQYDAAEFFLVDPENGRYLEFNLAPNGAWWSCEFTAPRQRARPDDVPFPDVVTASRMCPESWEASASLPLEPLRDRLRFGPGSRLNATATLMQPKPSLLTVVPLGSGTPDFHQPDRIPEIDLQPV